MTFEKLDDMVILKIRNHPGAKFADIYDDEVKNACSKLTHRLPPYDWFRVLDRRLQALRRARIIEYRSGWHLKR